MVVPYILPLVSHHLEKPLATSHAFSLLTLPSRFCLVLKSHLHSIGCLSLGSGTNDHVLFLIRASYSSFMAFNHYGLVKASFNVRGSVGTVAESALGLKIPILDLVIIG